MCMCMSSAHFVAAAAPAASIAFPLDVDNNVHIPALEELDGAFAHVFEVCGLSGDDVDDAEDSLLSGSVAVIVVMVMVMMIMIMVIVRVCMRVRPCVIVS